MYTKFSVNFTFTHKFNDVIPDFYDCLSEWPSQTKFPPVDVFSHKFCHLE